MFYCTLNLIILENKQDKEGTRNFLNEISKSANLPNK